MDNVIRADFGGGEVVGKEEDFVDNFLTAEECDPHDLGPPPIRRFPCCLCGKPTKTQMQANFHDRSICTTFVAVTVQAEMVQEFNNLPNVEDFQEGHIRTGVIDLCAECFEQKLMPWLSSQGGTTRVADISYGDGTCYLRPKDLPNVRTPK